MAHHDDEAAYGLIDSDTPAIMLRLSNGASPFLLPRRLEFGPWEEFEPSDNVPILRGSIYIGAVVAGVSWLVDSGRTSLPSGVLARVKGLTDLVDSEISQCASRHLSIQQLMATTTDRVEQVHSLDAHSKLIQEIVAAVADSSTTLDLTPLADASERLAELLQRSGVVLGQVNNFQLTPELRIGFTRICRLLRGLRYVVGEVHNCEVGGSPGRVVPYDDVEDAWSEVTLARELGDDKAMVGILEAWGQTSVNAHEAIIARFSFQRDADHRVLQSVIDDAMLSPLILACGVAVEEVQPSLTGILEAAFLPRSGSRKTRDWTDPERFSRCILDLLQALRHFRALRKRGTTASVLPREFLRFSGSEEEQLRFCREYRHWWLHHTDSGLLQTCLVECLALKWPSIVTGNRLGSWREPQKERTVVVSLKVEGGQVGS